jgi:3-hydroxyisobutyrate dehydrogenase
MKLVNNLLFTTALAGFGEALSLAAQLGLDVDRSARWLLATPGAAPYLKTKIEFLEAGGQPPQFALWLAEKDVRLAVSSATSPLPVSEAVRRTYQEASEAGLGDQDFGHVIRYRLGSRPSGAS